MLLGRQHSEVVLISVQFLVFLRHYMHTSHFVFLHIIDQQMNYKAFKYHWEVDVSVNVSGKLSVGLIVQN